MAHPEPVSLFSYPGSLAEHTKFANLLPAPKKGSNQGQPHGQKISPRTSSRPVVRGYTDGGCGDEWRSCQPSPAWFAALIVGGSDVPGAYGEDIAGFWTLRLILHHLRAGERRYGVRDRQSGVAHGRRAALSRVAVGGGAQRHRRRSATMLWHAASQRLYAYTCLFTYVY